ncbi:chemotaxis protein CheW [Sagittula sp. S175]|uniref:chemotaxis protein CheW n=1 Tax=Sagittula sp. S175 TaxID=3415129 RepID=UPI003C7BC3B5
MSAQPSDLGAAAAHGQPDPETGIDAMTDRDAVMPRTSAPSQGRIFGTFWLDNTEFALDIEVFREAVKEPAAISVVPLSPPYMKGLFNLRGTIIPIVDLRRLLDMPAPEAAIRDRQVAIVDDGQICVGLLVDRTGQVLTIREEDRVDLRTDGDKTRDVVIQGFLKLDGGQRIIQILDPREVLGLKKVPRGETLWGNGSRLQANRRRGRFNCLTFQFGHTTCAIDLRHVVEVRNAPEINDSVLVQDCFIGITHLRGEILPVADFRNFMGDEARLKSSASARPLRKMLVIQTDGGLIGLLVYSVDNIMSSFEDEIHPFTKLAIPRGDIVRGCVIGKNEQIIMLIDYEALRRVPILVETAQRCRDVHQQDTAEQKKTAKKQIGARMTFIVFTLDRPLALDTAQVSEVIKYPDTLLKPPYSLDFVDGILDLRGEMITILNARRIYGLPENAAAAKRIVILRHEGEKYGLVVDTVEEIARTSPQQVTGKMTINAGNVSRKIVEDDAGCIKSTKHGAVMVIDAGSLIRRCLKMADGQPLDAMEPR